MASGSHPRPRRAPKLGDSRSPGTTLVVLALATVAVIAGFVLLRSITHQTVRSADAIVAATTTTVAAPASTLNLTPVTSTTSTTTTVAPSAAKSDATVVVANASGVGGSATAMIAELAAAGYTMAPVANGTGPRLDQSVIYYLESDPRALGVAQLLAQQIPTAQTRPMPQPPPLDRPLNAATVALMLGKDAAGRSLAELQSG
jgi:hypothetical protein